MIADILEIKARLGTVMLNQALLARMLYLLAPESPARDLQKKLIEMREEILDGILKHYPKEKHDAREAKSDTGT